jgi:chemotaxis protein MotB
LNLTKINNGSGMAEEALDDEEQDAEDCPKCPPQGAPAWMATFADMATLLMAFFVLILSFAEFNVPKFKQISGSLKEAFGVQKVVPVVEQPKGTTVIELNFSPIQIPLFRPRCDRILQNFKSQK